MSFCAVSVGLEDPERSRFMGQMYPLFRYVGSAFACSERAPQLPGCKAKDDPMSE